MAKKKYFQKIWRKDELKNDVSFIYSNRIGGSHWLNDNDKKMLNEYKSFIFFNFMKNFESEQLKILKGYYSCEFLKAVFVELNELFAFCKPEMFETDIIDAGNKIFNKWWL
jgi:ferredoxin-NADP reductase